MRRPVVGVMGSGTERWDDFAGPLGTWLAGQGCHLLTGGGGGVMSAVSEAFAEVERRGGSVIGVLPGQPDGAGCETPPGYPNDWVEVAIRTHLPLRGSEGGEPMSRNHVNVLTADLLIVLPGNEGTQSEVVLAERYGRPVILFGPTEAFAAFPADVERTGSIARIHEFVRTHLAGRR